ncbi:MAG: glycoside hydrolase family 3 C-terminal domain-containing protein, partial [Clostridiales bacterium]|nr:glycoside hydrolase family 3 C-terminal domain-containing protein [Clostridiales bacterium]
MHKKHTKKRVPAWAKCVLAAVLAACLFAPNLATTNRGAFADANYNYFEFGYPSAAAMLADANSLNQEICEEGFTLLKNDGLLPMTPPSGQKIKASAFGNNSASLIYCGFGSSDNWKGETSVYDAFAPSVFELNPTLKAFYNDSGKSGAKINPHASIDNYRMGMDILETPRSAYTSDIIGSYQNYNDLAIVFLTRTAGEGSDLPTTSLQRGFAERSDAYKLSGARHWDDHYLQLDKNEVDMLQMVMDNFDKIMVVVNGSSYVELGFLDDPAHYLYTDNGYTGSTAAAEAKMAKFKAAINVNMPGSNGILALPRIMDGTVNPSGHLVDTFVRDMKNDPTYKNQGLSGLTEAELRYGEYYVHYDEDIYMGYRYY